MTTSPVCNPGRRGDEHALVTILTGESGLALQPYGGTPGTRRASRMHPARSSSTPATARTSASPDGPPVTLHVSLSFSATPVTPGTSRPAPIYPYSDADLRRQRRTVKRAIADLRAAGLVKSITGRGTYVAG